MRFRRPVRMVAAAAAAAGLVLAGGPAAAVDQEPIELSAPSEVVREYEALVGNVPVAYSGAPGDNRPTSCSQFTYCDNIPLKLSVPESLKTSDTKDYFMRLKIEWDDSGGNNLDTYLYNAPYPDGGAAPIASGATANMPETINLYRPDKSEYILVVLNRSGANTGYKVTAAVTIEDFGGAPDFGGVNETPPSGSPPSSSGGAGSDDDFGFEPATPDRAEGSDPSPGFDPLPRALADVDADSSLSALARRSGRLTDSLAAPPVALETDDEGPPPEPVSGLTVAIFGGLLPASVVGSGIWLLRRNGGAAGAGL